MGMDWLWQSTVAETDTPLSPREADVGTLRPEALEFIPQRQPLASQGDFPSYPAVEDIEVPQPSAGSEEEATIPETPEPKEQRGKQTICPPKRLTYDILGESSEEAVLTSQRMHSLPILPTTGLVEGNSNSPPGTSRWAIPISGLVGKTTSPLMTNGGRFPCQVHMCMPIACFLTCTNLFLPPVFVFLKACNRLWTIC